MEDLANETYHLRTNSSRAKPTLPTGSRYLLEGPLRTLKYSHILSCRYYAKIM